MIRALKLIKATGINITSTSRVHIFVSEIEFEMYFRCSV